MIKNKVLIKLLTSVVLLNSLLVVKLDESVRAYSPEIIIGADGRKYISDTTNDLHRKMVRITFEGLDEYDNPMKAQGSGVMIGNDIVITAAHCIYDLRHKQYYQNVKVTPAATWNGEMFTAPLGYSVALETEVLSSYIDGDTSQDIGVIKLQSPIGQKTGYLSLAIQSTNVGQPIKTIGYPGDRMGMYLSEGSITSYYGTQIEYNLDTFKGQSGSPILDNDNRVIAIHYRGGDDGRSSNVARIITNDVQELINSVNSTTGVVYRLYNPNSGWHHYTSDLSEKSYLVGLGWLDEGVAWESGNNLPVHRLYNPNSGHHFYTTNVAEKNALVAVGWRYENIAFYSGDNLNVFRLYNLNTGEHFYTVNYLEKDYLVSLGWRYEGIAFQTK